MQGDALASESDGKNLLRQEGSGVAVWKEKVNWRGDC